MIQTILFVAYAIFVWFGSAALGMWCDSRGIDRLLSAPFVAAVIIILIAPVAIRYARWLHREE